MRPDSLLPVWLATYLVHSTVLLGVAALLTSRRLGLGLRWREVLWHTAMLGALLTTTAQVALGPSPWRIDVPQDGRPAPAPVLAAVVEGDPAPVVGSGAPDPEPSETPAPPAPVSKLEPAAPAPERGGKALLSIALDVVLLTALGFALLAAVRVYRAHRALRRRLRGRVRVVAGPWRDALDALGERAGLRRRVRLSIVAGIGSPLARGTFRPEICVPTRAFEELGEEERDALLAHETGHVVRRDALRLSLQRVLETVLAVQPLNRLAGRRLREIAEFRCDRLASAWTGRPRVLAGCLTRVANWVLEGRAAAWLPAMASRGRLLERRVHRLLEAGPRRRTWHRGLAGIGALLTLLGLGLLIPPVATVKAGTSIRRPTAAAELPADATAPAGSIERLRAEIVALNLEMRRLNDALTRLGPRPELHARTSRLARRWDALRRRAAFLEDAVEGENR
jgi:beta-lactamase regulating signal transducer with metallopeptidase domain